ncbi:MULTISPECIES: hypothetical protein [unclassified Micromonospora]|uniref:hypothetical protein n=1 Tax=unclassified Micromonospora TaxID=2617518 RepID=UPI002FEE7031
MDHPAQRIVSDLREKGLSLEYAGDGWFALTGDSSTGTPDAFLHLTDDDVERYLRGMRAEDVDGVFGPDTTLDDTRHRLTLVHLEESLLSHLAGIRYVVLDGAEIRTFDTHSSPDLPAGDYHWTARPRRQPTASTNGGCGRSRRLPR